MFIKAYEMLCKYLLKFRINHSLSYFVSLNASSFAQKIRTQFTKPYSKIYNKKKKSEYFSYFMLTNEISMEIFTLKYLKYIMVSYLENCCIFYFFNTHTSPHLLGSGKKGIGHGYGFSIGETYNIFPHPYLSHK